MCISCISQRGGGQDLWVLPAHGQLSSRDQSLIFQHPARGKRKVVIATNIAETSITIDDVTIVIDTGRMKEMRYDADNKLSMLVEDWVSKANSKQRRGRAGRVQKGRCYFMYSRRQEERLKPAPTPEIQLACLDQLCLQITVLGLGRPAEFLQTVIEPPAPSAVRAAVTLLQEVVALDAAENLTPLGYHLAKLPMDVRLAKTLIYGCILRCSVEVLTVVAAIGAGKPPFRSPLDKRDEANAAKMR